MAKLRIPSAKAKPRDYTRPPWVDFLRVKFPTEKLNDLVNSGMKVDDIRDYLFAEKLMDYRKSGLVVKAFKSSRGIVKNDNEILFEINIPFCEFKCTGCKRYMYSKTKFENYADNYYKALVKEVEQAREIIKKKCYIVKSVCFKGNLLALQASEIDKLLRLCVYPLSEICIELDNPLDVTENKLEIIKKVAKNARFIVNALSFNTVSLRKMCRRYEFKNVYNQFRLITEFGFDMSIGFAIGIPTERNLQVERNLKIAQELGANCIDLYARNCPSNTKEDLKDVDQIAEVRKVLEFAEETLLSKGFEPYFLYCNECENGCFENVGFALPNKKCKFLEDKIYQISTVLGCGIQTESLLVKNLRNTKQVLKNDYNMEAYLENFDEILNRKAKFFK